MLFNSRFLGGFGKSKKAAAGSQNTRDQTAGHAFRNLAPQVHGEAFNNLFTAGSQETQRPQNLGFVPEQAFQNVQPRSEFANASSQQIATSSYQSKVDTLHQHTSLHSHMQPGAYGYDQAGYANSVQLGTQPDTGANQPSIASNQEPGMFIPYFLFIFVLLFSLSLVFELLTSARHCCLATVNHQTFM